MVMLTKYVDVEVDVDLSDLDLDDIKDLLAEEGYVVFKTRLSEDEFKDKVNEVCHLYRIKDERFTKEVVFLLSELSGKIL